MALPIAGILIGSLSALPAGARPEAQVERDVTHTSPELTPVQIAGPFEFPWSIGFLPDGAILVTEKPGRLQLIRAGSAMQEVGGVPPVLSGLHAGLLDVAVDSDFAQTGTLYLSYVHGTEAASTIRVLKARLDLAAKTLLDQQIIFESDPPDASLEQLGGRLALTGDGHLLLTLGDRWEGRRAQDLSDHAGSIIRIRLDGAVPEDNPFLSVAGAKPEIWTYGHRNPQGLAIEQTSGQVWSIEHGPQGGDELNLIESGLNYGWPIITFGVDYDGSSIGLGNAAPGMEQPVHHWTPSIAPSGLTVEQDRDQFKVWVGALAGQMIAHLTLQQGQVRRERHLFEGELGRIRDIRRGPDDLLYVITDDPAGWLYQLQPTTEQVEHDDAREPL
jgi:glucose/arabinose dehydrogenase